MPFLTQGKTNWKYILIVVILAIIVGGGVIVALQNWYKFPPLKLPFTPSAKKFSVHLDEEAKIIYERGEFLLSFENVDTQEGSIELNLLESGIYSSCFFPEAKTFGGRKTPNTLMEGEQVHCFTSEECSIVFKLIALENKRATFETWESCAPPGPKGLFLPTEILITEKETANWEIYRNEEYGFEIKYPDIFTINTSYSDIIVVFSPREKYACNPTIRLFEGTIEGYEESLKADPLTEIISKKDIFINNYKGVEIRSVTYEMGLVDICVLLPYNSKIYKICACEESDMEDIFKQMLSTFRFIE
ncbi:hypothetical protein KJA15_02405 [Patescibacteria group bacterium]|nr:hypothetical protein [Patescibacteria group bacterium]